MKRILVCALAAMILMASCLTAFATDYNTTTSYVTDDDGNEYLEVTTNVTEADENEMITYLTWKDADSDAEIDDAEVIYIDQKTAPANGSLTFSYRTAKGNLTGVALKSGTSTEGVGVYDSTVPSRTYTVSYNGATYTVTVPTAAVDTVITTDLTLVAGEEITSALYEGTTEVTADVADGKITIQDNAAFDKGTIVITSEATIEPIDPPTINSEKTLSAAFAKEVDGKTVETLTIFGYADTDIAVGAGDWGGIIVSDDYNALEAFKLGDEEGTVKVYEALYRGAEGDFAVQLVNKTETADLTNGTFAKIYVSNTQHTAYGDIITFEAAE